MKYVSEFPRKVRQIMTEWIPLPDGTKLAARIWLPEDALERPVPAVLEYLPYRRRDATALRDSINHPYLAGHGYACLRVDVRGTGDSDGLILDEYDHNELNDGKEAIAWIARQPWCTGKVGMWGISWGGFNSLQIAYLEPPALKAIITMCSTDDRYHGDCHYMGGVPIDGNMGWGNTFFSNTTRPPDPDVVGERWREMWMQRLTSMNLCIDTWLRHQRRDDYWRHGSVDEDYSRIKAAVYAVGGWADGYSNSIFSMLAGLPGPKKALIGPWAHAYPNIARPGPAIGFLQEALRWWDYWLKDIDNGIMDEPMVRAWMQENVPPQVSYEEWPGRWIAEPAWPTPGVSAQNFALTAAGGLSAKPDGEAALLVKSPQTLGMKAANWCPYGLGPDMSGDQRSEDGMSLCFDSAPLAERTEIFGAPVVDLEFSSDKPQAFVCARLCDVSPDGTSLRVSYGLLNLTHRESHEFPSPLEPGRRYKARVQLCEIAHAFPPGHRIRIALSTTYWPIAWPSPEAATLTVFTGASRFELPVRRPNPNLDNGLAAFAEPEGAVPVSHRVIRPSRPTEPGYRREFDVASGETKIISRRDRGAVHLDDVNLDNDLSGQTVRRIVEGDPLSAREEMSITQRLERPGWKVRTETRTVLTSSLTDYILSGSVDAYEGEVRVFSRAWASRIPRDFT